MTTDNKQTMTAHKVTQADRELFKVLYGYNDPETAVHVDAGKFDEGRRMQAIADHRIAAEKPRDDVIEECAKVAEGQSSICWSLHNRRGKQASDNIAKDIRAMKGSKT